MNGKTAKMLRRAATALSVIVVNKAIQALPEEERPEAPQRALALRETGRRSYKKLKARWYGTPSGSRGALRRHLQSLTLTVNHATRRAVRNAGA